MRSKYLTNVQLEVNLKPFKENYVKGSSFIHRLLDAIKILPDEKEPHVRMASLFTASYLFQGNGPQATAVADPSPVSPSISTKCLGAKLQSQVLKLPLGRPLPPCVGYSDKIPDLKEEQKRKVAGEPVSEDDPFFSITCP